MAERSRGRLAYQPALDGLRSAAVVAVFFHHGLWGFARGGSIGVDVFFVLSGFLITTLLVRERAATGSIDLRGFWVRRARRLLPSLLAVSLAVVLCYLIDVDATLRWATVVGVATALAYISSWVAAFGWWELGWMEHAWSLSVEEWFYAGFPLTVVLVVRRIGYSAIHVMTALATVYYLVAANLLHWSADRVYFAPDTRAYQLLVGCSLAVLLERHADTISTRVRTVAATAAALVLVAWLPLFKVYSPVYLHGGGLVVALATAVVIWYLMTVSGGLLTRVLAWEPFVWIGRRSYTIYLVHYPLYGLIPVGRRSASILVAPITIAYSAVSYRYLESRFLRTRPVASSNET